MDKQEFELLLDSVRQGEAIASTPEPEDLEGSRAYRAIERSASAAQRAILEAVFTAIQTGDVPALQVYHDECKFSVDHLPAYGGCTFVAGAVRCGQEEVLDFYIARKANLNKVDSDFGPLAQAVLKNDVSMFQKLAKAGANLDESVADMECSLYQLALNNDSTDILKLYRPAAGSANTAAKKMRLDR